MSNERLDRYFELMEKRPALFNDSENVRIEKDIGIIENYEQQHGVKIGIVYASKYNFLVVDLLCEEGKKYYTYERIIPFATGKAVVVVVLCKEKFVLLNQYRYPIGGYLYAFVRGFGESDLSGEKNTEKEVMEELGAQAEEITYLGEIYSDSGLCSNSVSVYSCNVENINCPVGHEGIKQAFCVSYADFEQMIKDGKISDGFTLSALRLYQSLTSDC